MRLASTLGRLVCAQLAFVYLSGLAGCEAMTDLPARAPADPEGSSGTTASRMSAQSGATRPSQQARRAPAARGGAGAAAPSYIGDVPARAASSGKLPCGSSEFSVGPCGGRPAFDGAVSGAGGAAAMADAGESDSQSRQAAQVNRSGPSDCRVIALPEGVRESYQLDAFYKQYASADGIPIVASDKPVARTLHLACLLVREMISERADVHEALLAGRVTFAIVATAEQTTDIPEYRDLPDYYDTRARGLGGHTGLCAEESILCDGQHDPWRGESICVHEYAHTIAIYGLFAVDDTFEDRLAAAFSRANEAGLWRDTFAAQDAQEYWAEGVQDWYDTNLEADPSNGVHGPVNTQAELAQHDRVLYDLIDELLPRQTRWPNCYR